MNTKTNDFQNGRAGFNTTIDLNKEVHQVAVSFYVKNVDLISLRQKYNYKEYEGENDRNERKCLLDR
jgi:hypothetical protein